MVPIDYIGGRLGNRMFQLAYIFAQQKRGLIPDIWLQYPHYFHEFEHEIREFYEGGIVARPQVSIHVRRGDYVTHPAFVDLCKTDYYERAIALFPDDTFLVFSDDIEWCKAKWAADKRFTFSVGRTEIEDLNAMAGCKSNIIANSSFSWWAAYLNPNTSKRVIYPVAWHTDKVQRVGFLPAWESI